MIATLVLSLSLLTPAPPTGTGWVATPDASLLCVELPRKQAREAFIERVTSATFCRSFPTGAGVLILRYRHKPVCLDSGLPDPDDFYFIHLTGKCGPVGVHSK
jgi:hypothetical protein